VSLGLGLYALKLGFFVLISGGVMAVVGPQGTYFEANNAIGMALAMNVPLLFYLSKLEPKVWLRWTFRAMVVLSYPAVVGTFARGDWLGLAVMTGMMGVKSKNKMLTATVALILVIMATPWIPQILSKELTKRYDTLSNYEEDPSAESRFWNWEFCTRIGLAHPATGAGFDFYSRELYQKYYPEFIERWGPEKVWSCHSMWLTIFAEHGIFTFILWVGILVSSFWSLGSLRRIGAVGGDTWICHCADMLQVALIGFMVMGTFVDIAYYEIYYQLVAVMIVLKQIVRPREADVFSRAKQDIVYKPALN
jgi:probable O-glycosylation ligase (exosortase A-associated)